MIDTVVFELNNLQKKYAELYKFLLVKHKESSKTIYNVDSPHTLLERKLVFMHNTGQAKESFSSISYNAPSSHYKIIMGIDPKKDIISFNVSIPKYMFGSNINLFCKHSPHHKGAQFINGHTDTIAYQVQYFYKQLHYFLNYFFSNEFPTIYQRFNMKDIELKRIDFCYMQKFPSKFHALEYLEIQKTYHKKYLRAENKSPIPYATSIHFANKDYSFKIYHKGTEFKKNDLKELRSANSFLKQSNTSGSFDLTYLEAHADCYLRYEMTLRQSALSQIYHDKIFRASSSTLWQRYKNIFNKVNYLLQKGIFTRENIKTAKLVRVMQSHYHEPTSILRKINLYYNKTQSTKLNAEYPNLTKSISLLTKFCKDYNNLMTSKKYFWMDLGLEHLETYRHDRDTNDNFLQTFPYVRVSQELLKFGFEKFWDQVEFFQPKQADNYNDGMKKLHEHNKLASVKYSPLSKIDVPSMSGFLLLMNTYSFDEICHQLKFDKQQKYRFKKRLEILGMSTKDYLNPLPFSPRMDLQDYFAHHHIKPEKFYRMFKNNLDY